jgi:hypothetical protein
MQKHVVVQKRLLADLIFYGIMGGILVAMFGWGLWSALEIQEQERQQADEMKMYKACKWPKIDGAMTVIAMIDGKLTCWVWQ